MRELADGVKIRRFCRLFGKRVLDWSLCIFCGSLKTKWRVGGLLTLC